MSITQGNAVCPAILIGLEEILQNGVPYELVTQVGFAQSLLDPTNRSKDSVVQNVNAENGHPKSVRIKHKQRATISDTRTSKTCTPGTERPYFEEVFTVNQYRERSIQVKESTVRTLCDAASQLKAVPGAAFNTWEGNRYNLQLMAEIVMEIMMDFDALRLAINQDLLTSLALNFGAYQGGSVGASKDFLVLRTTDTNGLGNGAPIFAGFNSFKQEMGRVGMPGIPLTFGEGKWDLALSALNYGCCNEGGIDFGKMQANAGLKYYKDFQAGTILGGADYFGAFLPGSLQFATYNDYVGGFARPIDGVERGTIPDPALPGIKYDMRVIPVACSGNDVVEHYNIIIGVHFDLWAAPTNMFKSGDRLNGVNGVFKAQATGA